MRLFSRLIPWLLRPPEAAGSQGTHDDRLLIGLTHSPQLNRQSMCDRDFSFVLRLSVGSIDLAVFWNSVLAVSASAYGFGDCNSLVRLHVLHDLCFAGRPSDSIFASFSAPRPKCTVKSLVDAYPTLPETVRTCILPPAKQRTSAPIAERLLRVPVRRTCSQCLAGFSRGLRFHHSSMGAFSEVTAASSRPSRSKSANTTPRCCAARGNSRRLHLRRPQNVRRDSERCGLAAHPVCPGLRPRRKGPAI